MIDSLHTLIFHREVGRDFPKFEIWVSYMPMDNEYALFFRRKTKDGSKDTPHSFPVQMTDAGLEQARLKLALVY